MAWAKRFHRSAEGTAMQRSVGVAALVVVVVSFPAAAEPPVVARPDAFETLVNPKCSHCRDEAARRADLTAGDRALCWTRGYSDGGAIPIRFFLAAHRVVSDSYGVFVYDPDAGYARGFAPSYEFRFHGWRNGVMVMRHADGTLFSCLSGVAFDGPRKGEPVTTTLAAYRPIARQPRKSKGPAPNKDGVSPPDAGTLPPGVAEAPPRTVTLRPANAAGRFTDAETNSIWDIAGRCIGGPLKGWTLDWMDGVQVKWFAWAAEYPHTPIYHGKD